MSELSATNPISKLPYDILREIFIHCLPRYPIKEQQPNLTIAPLLLCRICSFWRAVALASPILWSHLSYCLTTYHFGSEIKLVKNEVEFLRWWRKNQGPTRAPFLRLSVVHMSNPWQRNIYQKLAKGGEWAEEGMSFLFEYVVFAQYLDLGSFYWGRIQRRIEGGFPFVFPNLHTVAKFKTAGTDFFYQAQSLIRTPTLRRLIIDNDVLQPDIHIHIPIFCSTLTHISLHAIVLTLETWFSLICGVPNLEWGYIDIVELYDFKDYNPPAEVTLPQLSTLSITLRAPERYTERSAFNLLFRNVHLPAVRTLSLSWVLGKRWNDTAADLRTILKSTPGVTTLALAEDFLPKSFHALVNGWDLTNLAMRGPRGGVQPIWRHAAHLEELQLELPETGDRGRYREESDVFVRDTMFAEGSWLDLGSPACPIRAVTIVDHAPPLEISGWSGGDGDVVDLMMKRIRKHTKKAAGVVFQVASKSVRHIAAETSDEWAASI